MAQSLELVKLDERQLAALKEEQEKRDAERISRLDALAVSLAGKRKAAIEARANSGIEQIWLEDEDAFDGIDDLNRAQEGAQGTRHRYTKARTSSGPAYEKNEAQSNDTICTLLPNITGPYCEAGAASIADILLPLDDWPFGVGPTPIPELTGIVEQLKKVPEDQAVQVDGENTEPAGKVRDVAEQAIEKAKKCAEKAETRIKDWLTECQWHGKSRRQIDDSARVGTGIVKGPIPETKKHYVWNEVEGVKELTIHEEIKPVTNNVDYWNLFPDYPACGESIHNGAYVWERGEVTAKTLQDLRGKEKLGYIDSQIELCLAEGPKRPEVESGDKPAVAVDTLYEIWWFHGALDRSDLMAAGCDCSSQDDKYQSVPAVITVVNGRIIRTALNVLDKGSFPYDLLTWRRRPGMPWGQGIARQIRPAQQAITGCFRALMENAGLSAKPMLAVLRRYLEPTDGTWDLFGGKVFEVAADADVRDVENAIHSIQIESRQGELLNIIQFNKQLAEDITGQPLLLQGQAGKAPDTVGGMQILNTNVSVTRRRIARQFDDQVIEPGITRYYDYLMQYGEDEEEKGLFVIDARSSSVLVERDIQNKNMIQLLGASVNPAYGADPRKAYAEACKAMKIDPKRLQYTEDEWDQMQQNAAKTPPDPSIQVAQIRAEATIKAEQVAAEHEARLEKMRQEFEMAQNDLDRQLASAELTSEERRDLEKQKVLLATMASRLKVQERMAKESERHADDREVARYKTDIYKHRNPTPQVAPAAMEPAGRAPAGQAFQR